MNMKKKLSGLLSLWLAAILVFSMLPVAAMAEESAEESPTGTMNYYTENHDFWYEATGAKTVLTGGEVQALAGSAAPAGYHFVCWNTLYSSGFKAEPPAVFHGGEGFAAADVYTSFTLDLAAQWEQNTYTVRFDGNGATGGATASQDFQYDQTQPLNANGFERAYTVTFDVGGGAAEQTSATAASDFSGWAASADGSVAFADKDLVTNLSEEHGAEITLYAKWSDMGSITLPAATREHHSFAGWYTDAVDGTKIGGAGDSYTPAGTITLYAHWIADEHTVTFDVGGHGTAPDAQTVPHYGVVARPGNPSADGYIFGGWFTDVLCSNAYDFGAPVTGDLTLYALWKEASGGSAGEPPTVEPGPEPEPEPEIKPEPKPDPEPEPKPEPKPEPVPMPEPEPVPMPEPESASQGGEWRPVSQSFIVSISGEEQKIHVDATLNNKIAVIPSTVPAQLDTVIEIGVKTGIVKVDFSQIKRELDGVKIPTDTLKQIAEAAMDPENDTEGVEIIFTEGMSITLDAQALNTLAEQAKGKDVTFFFKEMKNADLTSQQKKIIVDQTAYDIRIVSGDTEIREFAGAITIQVPYTRNANEAAENISVSCVDENGAQESYETSYDKELETVSWVTDHLSVYMIADRKPASEGTYIIQKGDTLHTISQKFGCTVEEIMERNRDLLGENSILIYEGWELQLP